MEAFNSKRNALFASLDEASKELEGTGLDQSLKNEATQRTLAQLDAGVIVYRRGGHKRHATATANRNLSFLRGTESLFKKPELPLVRCLKPRKTPDYQIHPHKWKKYSLSDVDISDQTNTSAAFAFLKQMDERRDVVAADIDEKCSSVNDVNAKIEFKRSSKIKRSLKTIESNECADVEVDTPKLKGSKLVMPEYVIGERKQKQKPINAKQPRAAGTLALAHLQEDDEDADSDEG